MPVYEFICKDCKSKFAIFYNKVVDNPIEKCKCGSDAKKVISMFAAKYVGLGFATTDALVDEKYKEYSNIADHMYEKRAEQAQGTKISEDDAFWQETAKLVGD